MKKISFLLIALLCLTKLPAQTKTATTAQVNDLGKIAFFLYMPATFEDLDNAQAEKLYGKVVQIATANGVAASEYSTNFGIYIKLLVTESNVVEGGMQNITVVSADFTLIISQVENNVLFASVTKQIKGSGATKEAAINNAISKISASDPEYKKFMETGKQKIIAYYESKCDDMITYAANMAKMHDYADAIAVLMAIPIEVKSCYDKAQKNALAVYKEYQDANCAQMLVDAKANIAAKNYIDALNYLTEVDPQSKCSKEALELIKTTETKVNAEDKKLWDFAMKAFDADVDLQKHSIDAMKEIAIAVYKKNDEKKKDKRETDKKKPKK